MSEKTVADSMRRQGLVARRITANSFTKLCRQMGVRRSMGRVGSCFDNAAAQALFSSLAWEALSRHEFENTRQAKAVVLDWSYGFYNLLRRQSSAGRSPINYEDTVAPDPKAASGSPP